MNTTICEFCESCISKHNIAKHKKSDSCVKIQNIINKNVMSNKLLIDENEKLKNTILNLKNCIHEYENKMKILENVREEYKNLIDFLKSSNDKNISKFTNNFKKKYEEESTFQIDINLNNKQLNKTKYKDVHEEQLKKDIQYLRLKDNYILEYRETDGFINITNLCKAGGKEFKSWNRLDKTKRFLDVLSSEVKIHTSELLKVGTGSKNGTNITSETWAHPQIAINIAQWISPEFDVLVSKWVYEIMLTGKVDIKDNKTTQELDQMNKENKLLKNRVKLLESKVLQKQPRETFENGKNVIYIVTTEYKEAQGHYKIGKAKDLKERMSVYNTTDKHEVIYYTNCKNKKYMDFLEQLIHMKLESKRIEPNKEWFLSEEDAEDFIKIIEECKIMVEK
jgi:hypothetical protein